MSDEPVLFEIHTDTIGTMVKFYVWHWGSNEADIYIDSNKDQLNKMKKC